MIKLYIFAWHTRGFLVLFPSSVPPPPLSASESADALIGCLGSVATVIIFLQMLEWELRGGGERGGKTSAADGVSTAVVEVIYPLPLRSIAPPPFQSGAPPPPLAYVSQFHTSRLSLHPGRQLGQPVFTAEVIGVVRRGPDPGPAKAPDKCVCV